MSEALLVSSEVSLANEDELLDWLHSNRRTDGLPVVLPTRERVESMLFAAALVGLDRDVIIGSVPPNQGEATVEKIAINAVMAGCAPEHFCVVVAAVRAVCDIRLDLAEVQATTHELTPLIIVNGPVISEAGLASGYGVLGYGHRANLSIGRAVRLCLINLGGGWPGASDMTVIGHPGKLAFCLAEDEANSPFPPLHTSFGFGVEESAVTVMCVGAPHSVLAFPDADDPLEAERVLELLARTIAGVGNNNSVLGKGTVVVCLNPDHARILSDAGYTRSDIQHQLCQRATNPRRLVEYLRRGANAPTDIDPGELVPAVESPDSIVVVVAGGSGFYSAVMLPWTGGPHANTHITVEVVTSDACEVPVVA
ncbi:hypothetical protein SAMN05892883_4158 [Jatrophihabitans sp. GAS493]|uniref:hypothetical protein n=1 Tax=Jatrophihabitans sp. GAS493 TaxID=1907575 RepID=UPI000BB8F696|nr:hypothetical protein [Jatrophihabitans sp. GAS493]SOD74963.1 hypothetical protein SAMN05892883_4158 [Jatrophihabitans sp. GAS493]